jgi:hypothetical protein
MDIVLDFFLEDKEILGIDLGVMLATSLLLSSSGFL